MIRRPGAGVGAAESFYICRRCRGMRHFPTKEMGPTFGRGHFPTKEMDPTFGRGHFPTKEMGPTFGRGHFPTKEMGPTFGRRHFPTKEEDMPQLMEQTINTFNHLTKEVQ